MQVSAFSAISIGGAGPDVLLVTLVAIALLRGSITGAVAGFLAGLIVDVTTLGSSASPRSCCRWRVTGPDATARRPAVGRPHAPLVATVAATLFVEVGG